MADEATLKIGAIVSTDQLQAGMQSSVDTVRAATSNIGISFQEMTTKAQAAAFAANRSFKSISEETKVAAESISQEARVEAELAEARIAAMNEVRAALRLLSNEQFDAAKATELYAAATQKLKDVDAQIAAAEQAKAAAIQKAREEMELQQQQTAANELLSGFGPVSGNAGAQGASERVAALTLEEANAKQRLKDVTDALNISTLDEVSKERALAAAQAQVKATTAERIAAEKEAAAAMEEAAIEAKLSSNEWVAAFQRIALGAKESFAQVQETMAGTVERAGITANGIRFGFSGLSELLGAGVVVGMGAEFIDELAKVNLELDHLSVQTGINITSLAGLQQIVKGMGGEWEPVANSIIRLSRAQVQASEGVKTYQQAFLDLGITLDEVSHLSPEAMLNRVSRAIADNGNVSVVANSALTLFSRGGKAMIPILKEQGENLEKNMKQQGELTGITEKSADAARRWTEDMASLTAEMRRDAIPVLEYLPDIIRGIVGALQVAFAGLVTLFESIAAVLVSTGHSVLGFAKVLFDVATGNFSAIKADSEEARKQIIDTWKSAGSDIAGSWKSAKDSFFGNIPTPPRTDGGKDDGIPIGTAGSAAKQKLQDMQTEYAELQQTHQLTLKEEHDFWAQRIGQFQKGSSEYRAIAQKLGSIYQEAAKKGAADRLKAMEDERAAEEEAGTIGAKADADFWRQRIDAFSKGSEQYHAIQQKIARDDVEGAKQAHELIKKFEDEEKKSPSRASGDLIVARTTEEINKLIRTQAEDVLRTGQRWEGYNKSVEEGTASQVKLGIALDEGRIRFEEAAGGLTPLAAAQLLAADHALEHAQALKLLEEELARLQAQAKNLKPGDVGYEQNITRQQTVQNQITQEKGNTAIQGQQDQQTIDKAVAQPYLKAFDHISQGWLKVQNDLILGNKNIARDFVQMGVSLVQSMAQNFEQMLVKQLQFEIQTAVAHRAGNQMKVADDATSAGQSATIHATSALKEIFMDAKTAAAGAWKATVGIPIVGPILAPIAAGTTFAGVMALAAFEHGGIVDGSAGMAVPILAHAGERVLTPQQTNNFESLVNNPRSSHQTSIINAKVNQHFASSKASSARETRQQIQQLHRRGKLALS